MSTNSFWTEGPERLAAAMKERRREIDELLKASKSAESPAEKASLRQRFLNRLREYSPSKKEIDRSLFFLDS